MEQSASHACSLAVWDVPSPAPAAGPLRIKAGVRCSAGCRLAERRIEVRDAAGAPVAGGTLGATPWTGTRALYWTEVELPAPAAEGVHSRIVALAGGAADSPHVGAPAAFTFRAVRADGRRVIIRVVEEVTRKPVEAVEVRAGPYAASTDARGVAAVMLPSEDCEVSIRKRGFRARPVRVRADGEPAVEIAAARVPTQADLNERTFEQYPWG